MNKPSELPHTSLVVVLVNYQSAEDTLACIRSIRAQDPEVDPYFVVIDNSEPNEEKLQELHAIETRVHLIFNEKNTGFGQANNQGIRWAQENLTFEYLLLLNNDTTIATSALTILMKAFRHSDDISIATGKIMYYDQPEIVWYGGADINYKKGWPDIIDLNQKASAEGANRARYVTFASGCMMLFSNDSLKLLKGFDPDFFMYCEDLELCLRATKAGLRIWYEPQSVIYHKVHGSNTHKEEAPKNLDVRNPNVHFLFYHLKKNQYLAMRKHLTGWTYIRFVMYFWARFNYFVFKMLFAGKFGILKTSMKTRWSIFKIIFTTRLGRSSMDMN